MSDETPPPAAGKPAPLRYSLRELLRDIDGDGEALGGVGKRLLDQHEIDQIFKHGDHGSANDGV